MVRSWALLLAAIVLAFGASACSSQPACGDACTAGLSCKTVIDVSDDAELTQAAASATTGTCIALAPGTYGDVTLPGGVSLVGGGPTVATVGSVTMLAGSSPVLRGVHVAGVVKVQPAVVGAELSGLLVTGSENGVQAETGASFTLEDSTIQSVPVYAVLAVDAAAVTIKNTQIEDSGGPGIWVQCSAGCGCTTPPTVDLEGVTLERNVIAGLVLIGSVATVNGLTIDDTQASTSLGETSTGGAIALSQCASMTGGGVQVSGPALYGMLVDGSSLDLGNGTANGIVIIKGGGIFTQNLAATQSIKLANASVTGSSGIGIDLGGGSHGIVIINSRVEDTATIPMLTTDAGMHPVGDGLIWSSGVDAQISALSVANSGRNAVLIDGPVGANSSLGVTLSGTDVAKGVVQEGVMMASQAPTITSGPPVMQTATQPYAVPAPIAAPAGL
jgi:hypothetical protein